MSYFISLAPRPSYAEANSPLMVPNSLTPIMTWLIDVRNNSQTGSIDSLHSLSLLSRCSLNLSPIPYADMKTTILNIRSRCSDVFDHTLFKDTSSAIDRLRPLYEGKILLCVTPIPPTFSENS